MTFQTESENTSKISNLHEFGIDEDNRYVYLNGEISEDSLGTFIKNLNYLNFTSKQPITAFIASLGGSTTFGMGIYDAVKLSTANIRMVCCGEVSSMATVILQAASLRLVMPNVTFMVHEGSIALDQQAKAAISTLNWYKSFSEKITDIYVDRCRTATFFRGKTRRYIRNFIKAKTDKDEDWYLDANETIKYGFADKIYKGITSLV